MQKINLIKKNIRDLFLSLLRLTKHRKKIIVSCASVVFLLVFLQFYGNVYFAKDSQSSEIATFKIEKGESLSQIAKNLESQGIIKNDFFFVFYARLRGISNKLKAGTYELSPSMSVAKIAQEIYAGSEIKKKVTIFEGWDFKNIAEYLEKENIFYSAEVSNVLYSLEVQKFLYGIDCIAPEAKKFGYEGYFFPDTYEVTMSTTPSDFLKKIFFNFDKKLTSDLRDEISRQKKTIFDIIIMASIIEKEAKLASDKKIVSGILWKRMEIGMALQADATILYEKELEGSRLSLEDTKIDSLYNTYQYKGLPPGPISNPGIESIKAAVYPTKTNYLYYLSAPDGKMIFSQNFEQHKAAKAKYLK